MRGQVGFERKRLLGRETMEVEAVSKIEKLELRAKLLTEMKI